MLDGDGTGTYILRVLQRRTAPAGLAVALGEWLYNLRASLDYVIWATACYVAGRVPPPNEGVLQYPIYDEEAAWKRNEYRLKGLHRHHREMLLVMQPFNSDPDANHLGWLNRLARIDRHRTLVTGAARFAQLEPVLQVPDGAAVTVEWGGAHGDRRPRGRRQVHSDALPAGHGGERQPADRHRPGDCGVVEVALLEQDHVRRSACR